MRLGEAQRLGWRGWQRLAFGTGATLSPRALRLRLMQRMQRANRRTSQIAAALEQVCGIQRCAGNAVQILENGSATFPAMLRDIAAATSTINFENYIFESDATGWEFANALAERALAGVTVNLLYDAIGSASASPDLWAFLEGAGVRVRVFRPLSEGLARAQSRDHRKLLVIDGQIAYIGGHCIGDCWAGRKPGEHAWRDTHCRIEGPIVAELQRTFCECWVDAGGEACVDEDPRYFPRLEPRGAVELMTLTCGVERGLRQAYLTLLQHARKRVLIANAYFCPDEELLAAFKDAARRGVRVRLILPSMSDHDFMVTAARSTYAELLEAGVEIYEYQPSVLHTKTALVDGCWATIGSCNLDSRSLVFNYEANIGICSRPVVRALERTFKRDLRRSERIRPEHWHRRPLLQKFVEGLLSLVSHHL